jgi:hypothetical protein
MIFEVYLDDIVAGDIIDYVRLGGRDKIPKLPMAITVSMPFLWRENSLYWYLRVICVKC